MLKKRFSILVLAFSFVIITGCTPEPTVSNEILISLIADGRERTFAYDQPITVGELLRDTGIELSELDRVNPQPFTQIANGMVITVVRVVEETECEEVELPYRQRSVLNEGLTEGEERIGQAGQNGIERICYRIRIENNQPQDRIEVSRVMIESPIDEVLYIGPSGEIDPVSIQGTLTYINNQNAWLIRGSSLNKRPITTTSDLDALVFDLAEDGDKLLYSRESAIAEGISFANELWLLTDISNPESEPVQLIPTDVLQGYWIPDLEDTISYSTAVASEVAPGWRALNDFWAMRIDPETGNSLRVEELLPESSFGLYSWWGTQFSWSRDGRELAWVRADSIGLVDLESGEFQTLLEFPVFNTRQSWSWRTTVSWSPDNQLIAATTHVPIGNYPPETSPAFSVAVVSVEDDFNAVIKDNTGIWSTPTYAPNRSYLAYLKARDPFNSINGEYDLMIADYDGSNAVRVFPELSSQAGLLAQQIVWSPDGSQIALIYQGNLWLIDVGSQAIHQLTLDGGASSPMWR